MQNFLKRYEMVFFFLLTYLLSWWSAPLMNGALIPQGPMLAAILLVAATTGRQGLRAYWKQLTHWRAGPWYWIGPLVILGYTGIAFAANLWSGATLVEMPRLLTISVFVQLLFFGGQWEEPGWTGYALPQLEERFAKHPNGALIAALVLGVFRALWHLPLFLGGKLYWFDIFVFSFAVQSIIAWLYHRSGRSVPAVMLFHFVSNLMGAILSPLFVGAEQLTFYAIFVSLAVVFAVVITGLTPFKRRRERAAPMESL
jgi:uncharacterized protein